MVNIETNTTIDPVIAKTVQLISILYANDCNHLFIAYHANGDAINNAARIIFKKSFDKRVMMVPKEAPNTLRILISFIRFTAAKVTRPNNPRQARNTETPPAHPMILLHLRSDL